MKDNRAGDLGALSGGKSRSLALPHVMARRPLSTPFAGVEPAPFSKATTTQCLYGSTRYGLRLFLVHPPSARCNSISFVESRTRSLCPLLT